jgi:antitoxin HicB
MSKHIGTKFDDFLKEENIFDETEAVAIKRVLAYQFTKELEKKHLSKTKVAHELQTSRAAIDRVLDPANTSITLKTIVRVAHILGKKVKLSLAT